MKYRDREWLYEEFYVKKRKARDIGEECGVGQATINTYARKFGINELIRQDADNPLYKDRDWLYDMYYVRRMSSPEIADQCGVSRNAIHKYVKKFDIPNQKPALEEEVELLCHKCKEPFTRTLRNLLQRIRQHGIKLCCSNSCAASVKMSNKAYAENLHKGNLRFKESDEGKAAMRAMAIKSNLKQAANRGRTSIEQTLAEEFERRNIRYVEQYKVGEKFLSDFYLPEYNAIVEADGRFWHSSPRAIEKDKRKNVYIKSRGYILYRFWDDEINEDVSACVDTIFERGLHNGEVKTDERA